MEIDSLEPSWEVTTVSRRLATLFGLGALVSGLTLWLVAVPAVSAGDPCYHGFEMPAATVASDSDIQLQPCAFSPTITNVAVGATVTFHNGPELTHLITGANQAWGSRDVEVQPNKTVAYAFDKAGIYPYACALHRGMSGVIVVGDVASAGSGTAGAGATTTGAAAPPEAATAAAGGSGSDTVALVAISAGAGAFVGALVVFVALRRRTSRQEEPVAGIA
jgi:plastocyanin